ncbi:hypothetical protein PILCRDRAFT_339656 [Piloderma croceum F 1598]|uniref:BHLH domain-containing protein n=1 Tax=Piloderma croceum (strain F 1598) TaxID=765440 RepID=A0A0C3BH65_PILCF|nr:hypothetical protein PILCRDRAFT_339656 [Piloderma croceum F 1598]
MTSLKDRPSSSSLRDEKGMNGDPVTKQAILANEKRRRRRESHNAVERRRRDNINEKISELATLIPECMLDPSAPVSSPTATDEIFNPNNPALSDSTASQAKKETSEEPTTPLEAGVVKANKGMILRKSVEYIRYLQQLVSAQANRNRELEQALSVYREVDDDEGPCRRCRVCAGADTYTYVQ